MAACLVGTIACIVLAGWIFGIPALTSIVPGLVSMKTNTALAFVMLSAALCATAATANASTPSGRQLTDINPDFHFELDQRFVRGPHHRPHPKLPDVAPQVVVRRNADRVLDATLFQGVVKLRSGDAERNFFAALKGFT